MTRLVELAPQLVAYVGPGQHRDVEGDDPTQADGIMFVCPHCYGRLGGQAGAHSILVWFRGRGVPDSERPGPGRWVPSGTSFANLSLSPSIDIGKSCGWHGWIRDGEAT